MEYVKNVQPEFMELFVKRAPQQVFIYLFIYVFLASSRAILMLMRRITYLLVQGLRVSFFYFKSITLLM